MKVHKKELIVQSPGKFAPVVEAKTLKGKLLAQTARFAMLTGLQPLKD
jgi:hypothetical protein